MADRRTRHRDSPHRRRRESTKETIRDEPTPSRAPYQPPELSSSYSSSSSYIDISRTYPANRPRGLGAIRAFFTTPSEHHRRLRRRTSRPSSRGNNSSSSSINSDLAYGTGFIRRRKSDKLRRKGKEGESSGRRDPRADVDPDAAILEVGVSLAALARKQNRLDLAEARRAGILPPKREGSGLLKGVESNRGLGSSKISQGPDEDGWESDTEADSEISSVDSNLAYGHDSAYAWGFGRSGPRRKSSVVDPALFGPANSLNGIIQERVGFDDVDHENLSDYPPPTIAALQKEEGIVSASASATGPLQYVYPISTSDPTRFDATRSSVVSTQEPYTSRPAPVPIQQPQPIPLVPQSVFEPPYSTKPEPKIPSSSGRIKSSVAGAALAGVAGAAIGTSLVSDRQDERKDKEKRLDENKDSYDRDRAAERRKDDRRDAKYEGADDRRERRRERGRDETEDSREKRQGRRREEGRDDPDKERREKRREKRRDDDVPIDGADRRREDKYSERSDDRYDDRRSRKDAPIVPPIDPFQYQVADDAFKTPDGTRNAEPFTGIQRARSPAIVTVERVPHWERAKELPKEPTIEPVDDNKMDRERRKDTELDKEDQDREEDRDREGDREYRDRRRTEREAESLYEETEHFTAPIEASAIGAAVAAVTAEERRHSRDKIRKRRYEDKGDSSPNRECDPIQEEADRIYREAVLARKIAESKNEDPVVRVVTPPEMAHKREKEVLYPVPNADFELDRVMDPAEYMTSPIKGPGAYPSDWSFDSTDSVSVLAPEALKRPLLTLIRPTPTPSPAPEEQKKRSERKDSSRDAEPSERKKSGSNRTESSRDVEQSEPRGDRPERKGSSRDTERSESRMKDNADTVVAEAKGDTVQTPTSANGSKGVTWGQNETKHYEVESPSETKDDPIASSAKAPDSQEKPKMSKERKASAWGALRGAFVSGAAAEVVAKAVEASKDEKDAKPDKKETSQAAPFEYRGVVVEPELSDHEVKVEGPPAVGPKPSKAPSSNMPGAFGDDLDFTATLAAGLEDSGFDPNIVINDPTYRRRSSPPGSEDPPLTGYQQPYAETVSDLGQYADPSAEKARDIKAKDGSDVRNDRRDKVQKKLDKAAKRQMTESQDPDLSQETPVTGQLVEEPQIFSESSKSSKKEKKSDKSKKSKTDSYEEADDRSDSRSGRVSVPVDAFDDLRTEAVSAGILEEEWVTSKKSKKKSKRDSDQFDPPSRSMSTSDIASSVEKSSKKLKDKSSRRSVQYDSEPNPEDIPLPTASEASKDDDHESRKSKRSSKRSSSISDVADRDARSVRSSDNSRYGDDEDTKSSKEKSSGFFGGFFGSSTSKSEPERSRDSKDGEESVESKKKSKKSKRSSTGDGSEINGRNVKTSPNGNGYGKYDDDDGGTNRPLNGDSKSEKAYEKEESFLDDAGTLGAGVGFAAAIALTAQHQQSKAIKAEIEESVPRRSIPEHVSPAQPPAPEISRDVFEEGVVDPEISQRQFRPSIDPQFGDLLSLPPSDPGSPNLEPIDALPSLPESRPGTPPITEDFSNRRKELPALIKTPSESAVPIKFIMGNRSTPSSPAMVRASPMTSPSTTSDGLGFPRSRPRPTSWESTKGFQPLLLLDPSRREAAAQNTDSEAETLVAEESTRPAQVETATHVPELDEEVSASDARDIIKEPVPEESVRAMQDYGSHGKAPIMEFPDLSSLPPLPESRTTTPIGKREHDLDISGLPPLPKSGSSTPAAISDLSGLPQLPESRSSTPAVSPDLSRLIQLPESGSSTPATAFDLTRLPHLPDSRSATPSANSNLSRLPQLPESRSLTPLEEGASHGSDSVVAGLLTDTAVGLTAGALALSLSRDEPRETSESAPKSISTEELPAEFHVEPITKDRSSYLFQSTPPLKRTKDVSIESPLEQRQSNPGILSRTVEDGPSVSEVIGSNDECPMQIITKERAAALEALTRSGPEDKALSEGVTPFQSVTAAEAEAETANGFSFTKSKKNKRKDKKKQEDRFDLEDEPSSSAITPPSISDVTKETDVAQESSLKKSKKDRKRGKEKASSQLDAEDVTSGSAVLVPALEAAAQERYIVDEPSQHLSSVVLPSFTVPEPKDHETVEEFSFKKSKKEKKDEEKGSEVIEKEYGTVLSPPAVLAAKQFGTADEPSELLSRTRLPSSMEPTVDNINPVEEFLPKKSKKDKKRDKKKASETVGIGDETTPAIVLPSSVVAAAREADPSDEYSSTTSKKDKKKVRKDRKSLSRTSTLVEPSLDESNQTTDAVDEVLFKAEQTSLSASLTPSEAGAVREVNDVDEFLLQAEQTPLPASRALSETGAVPEVEVFDESLLRAENTPLPVSRALSEVGASNDVGDVDESLLTAKITPLPVSRALSEDGASNDVGDVDESLLRAKNTPLPVSRALSEVGAESDVDVANESLLRVGRTPLSVSRALSEAEAASDVDVVDENLSRAEETRLPVSRALSETGAAPNVGEEHTTTKEILPIQGDSRLPVEPVMISASRESKKGKKKNYKSLQSWEFEEPSASGAIINNFSLDPEEEPQADVISAKESKKSKKNKNKSQETLEPHEPSMSEPVKAAPLRDEPPGKDVVQKDLERESPVPVDPVTEKGDPRVGVKDAWTIAIIPTEDDQSKSTEPLSTSNETKESKKGKKKKGKSSQAWQDDEGPDFRPTRDLISKPTTEAPFERENVSSFTTPTSKSKGKKNQKRQSIAWDIQEPEPEASLELSRSIEGPDLLGDGSQEAYSTKESSEVSRLDLGKDSNMPQDTRAEPSHVQEPTQVREEALQQSDVPILVAEKSATSSSPTTAPKTCTESEPLDITQTNFSRVEYFPSAASLHSPRMLEDEGAAGKGYFPSAMKLLSVVAPITAAIVEPKAPEVDQVDRTESEHTSLSTVPQKMAVEARDDSSTNFLHTQPSVEPSVHSQEDTNVDAKPLTLPALRSLTESVADDKELKQSRTDYFPSAAFLHSPPPPGPEEGASSKDYLPSATNLLPFVALPAALLGEHHLQQAPLAKELQDDKRPLLPSGLESEPQPRAAAAVKTTELPSFVAERDISDTRDEARGEQSTDSKQDTAYADEQLEAARQLNAEFGSGKKRSKKNKKNRADVPQTLTQDDDLPIDVSNEPEESTRQIEVNREGQVTTEPQTADGLAAGYKEDQVLLAKQLQAEFEIGSKKSKKGKKSRSTSRTPQEFVYGSSSLEIIQPANVQLVAEVSREVVPQDRDISRTQNPDGPSAGYSTDQVEVARQMREDFTSSSKKSKKDKKRQSLIRSAADENTAGKAVDGDSEDASLATTEVESATDSPYLLSTVPTPDDFGSSFTTKQGKKVSKKRQSLLRSLTQESEGSADRTRDSSKEPEVRQLETTERDIGQMVPAASDSLLDPEDKSSPVATDELEAFIFTTKKGKKANKKRQSLLSTATQEEQASRDPVHDIIEPQASRKEIAKASESQPANAPADADLAALGEVLNFNLKSKKDKQSKKGKEITEAFVGAEDVTQQAEQDIVKEQDLGPNDGHDQGSLADRIWAGIMPSESLQPDVENPSAESEDPLSLYTTKKSKKNKKAKAISASGRESSPLSRDEDLSLPKDEAGKSAPLSWADEVVEAEKRPPKPTLFDTWSFNNLPQDDIAQDISIQDPQAISNESKIVDDSKEDLANRSGPPLLPADDPWRASPEPESEKPSMGTYSSNISDRKPIMTHETASLVREVEPTQEQAPRPEKSDPIKLPKPEARDLDEYRLGRIDKHSISNPVSTGILAAGATLLAGTAMGHGRETAQVEPVTAPTHPAPENDEVSSSRSIEPENRKDKGKGKTVDRRSLLEDNLFNDPKLWEGPETPKFEDHIVADEAEDNGEFWSAPTELEGKITEEDSAVMDDVPPSAPIADEAPHKRGRSASLMDVWQPSTVLDHIKIPRKHHHEDIPTAMARDAILEQEAAEQRPMQTVNLNLNKSVEEPVQTSRSEPVPQWNDVPEDLLIKPSENVKNKKQSLPVAWEAPTKPKDAEVEIPYIETLDTPRSHGFDAAPTGDVRTPVIPAVIEDDVQDRYRDPESRSPSSSAKPFISDEMNSIQKDLDEETSQPGRRRREESARDKHRHEEIYLPPSSTIPQIVEGESVQQRGLEVTLPQPPNEGRAKDKHRRQETYLPPPSALPVVIEEEDHKSSGADRGILDSGHISRERGVSDNNRDSALVTDSPVPFQRRFADDHEYARDSGVHLRDWADAPVSKVKSQVASADDALARLSWPAVKEATEAVDLKQSQRPKGEPSPKSYSASTSLAGATAIGATELASQAVRSSPKHKDEREESIKVERPISPNIGRLQTPDNAKYRPGSVGSNRSSIRSSGTPPLRRSDRKLSGDLRSLSQRSQANLAKEAAKDALEAERSPATSFIHTNPIANEGRVRAKDMADVYDGYGEGRIGSPMSPTRPHSMRRRQSMQVLDLEARVEQLDAENRMLAEAKELAEHSLQSSQRAALALAGREAEVDSLKQRLDWLQREVERLREVNDGLTSANITLGRRHNERYGALETQHVEATRELEELRQTHGGLSAGMEGVILDRVAAATQEKDREIAQLRQDLEAAHEQIRQMQREILIAKDGDKEFLVFRDEDYFDNACQQLCHHVQQWVLRFSKFSDMRACRLTTEINNDKIIDRLDNAVLDGSDVDEYLSDRVKRRDIFMSMTMTMIWDFVFTRYLFGMDREQRQKLKSLEKTLLEVGPPAAVHQWRATTLTLLSRREAFQQQREQDTVAVVQAIFQTLSEILPPPTHLEDQIQEQLMRVMKAAVDLSIEMRTQRAEYMMLPPLQPEYDANGDLVQQVQFNAAVMNERSGDTVSNKELEAQHAVVRIVLFPLVVKKGDDSEGGDNEIVVCPAQVLVAKPKRHARHITPDPMGQNPNHSMVSMQSSMPVDQHVPDI